MKQIIIDFGALKIGSFALPLRIYGYGLMLVCGFLCGILLAQWRARRAGEPAEAVAQCGVWALLGGVFGARLAYVIEQWDTFRNAEPWKVLDVSSGGLIYFGGLLGGTAAVLIYLAVKRLPLRRFIDIVAPSLMIGLAFGRAGCLLNGCCKGGPCRADWPLAMRFPMYSRPLLVLGGEGDNPYSPAQENPSPPYSEQYVNDASLQPDERLVNEFMYYSHSGHSHGGEAHGSPVSRPAILSPRMHHGRLERDQLAVMFGSEEDARARFAATAGADGLLDEADWKQALRAGDGLLCGSEIWDEAQAFDAPPADGKLSFQEVWNYLQTRRKHLVRRFDADADGTLTGAEYQAADAYLREDMFALAAREHTGPLRPAQLLGIVNGLLLAGLLLAFSRHRRREGQVFALMLILYPITRFLLESIRNDDPLNVVHGHWTHNQVTAVILVLAGLLLWFGTKFLPASAGPVGRERKKQAALQA
jgi:prolipoprotein diacylglyceryltransferase